jgi:hypothetical protein
MDTSDSAVTPEGRVDERILSPKPIITLRGNMLSLGGNVSMLGTIGSSAVTLTSGNG